MRALPILLFLCLAQQLYSDTIPQTVFKGKVFYYRSKSEKLYPYPQARVTLSDTNGKIIADTITDIAGNFVFLLNNSVFTSKGVLITIPGKILKPTMVGCKGRNHYHTQTLHWYDPALPVELHVKRTGRYKKKTGFLKRRRKIEYL